MRYAIVLVSLGCSGRLLADPSTLGRIRRRIRPKVIRGRRSIVATGPLPGQRFRLQVPAGRLRAADDLGSNSTQGHPRSGHITMPKLDQFKILITVQELLAV